MEAPYVMARGDTGRAIEAAPHKLKGRIYVGGQEHFYLEGQAALAVPGEDGDVTIYCSTQHPSEIQHTVAKVLGLANNSVTVEVRRMGGGFGGKESNGNLPAATAAIIARQRIAMFAVSETDFTPALGVRRPIGNAIHDSLASISPTCYV